MEDDEFWDTFDLMEENRSLQCYVCAGFAVDCPCEENQFSKEQKLSLNKLIEEL